jgi:DNA (cytosine-5)-methyltransferase 1
MTIDVFDFFSGCGGTSCGFAKAGLNIKLGLDFDHDSAETFRLNFPKASFLEGDIRHINVSELAGYVGNRKNPLLFSGCAPCQPFSSQNRQQKKGDARRNLLSEFGRFVISWRPEYVFVENVPGMQKVALRKGPLTSFLKLLKGAGYSVSKGVVAASSFGVPQTRERFVLLASRDGIINLPKASHGLGLLPISTVREWISGLQSIEAGERSAIDPDHQAAKLSSINLERISSTPAGGGRESWPRHLWLPCHVDHVGHTDVYGRLAWDRPASGLTTRCISYSNGRFGHPEQHRGISLREAANLQTFPIDYKFSGTLTSKARQVGNAVPPLMAERFGAQILAHAAGI